MVILLTASPTLPTAPAMLTALILPLVATTLPAPATTTINPVGCTPALRSPAVAGTMVQADTTQVKHSKECLIFF